MQVQLHICSCSTLVINFSFAYCFLCVCVCTYICVYNDTMNTISLAGHTDHATFPTQLTASDYCWFQHHISTPLKHFTNQFNEYTTLTFYWVALQHNSITQRQPFLLFGGNSDLVDATSVKRALYKDYCNQFTIHLQICHQNIMLYMTAIKYFWKQNRCYTDGTSHCFFMLYLLLFTLMPS